MSFRRLALLHLLLITPAFGAPLPAALQLFEARYHAARQLQATFLERYSENGQLARVEAGTAYFRRPGKMRWEYQSPEKNLFLVDGKTAWFYVPADHVVTRVPAKQSADWRTPLALLAGEVNIARLCKFVDVAPRDPALSPLNILVRCQLRGEAKTAATVFLELVQSSGELVRLVVDDPGGVSIEFKFANWQFNPALPESLFQFTPPPGVAIVNGQLPAAPVSGNP